jgi:hypothetical protein
MLLTGRAKPFRRCENGEKKGFSIQNMLKGKRAQAREHSRKESVVNKGMKRQGGVKVRERKNGFTKKDPGKILAKHPKAQGHPKCERGGNKPYVS